jgi:hypothetical protein
MNDRTMLRRSAVQTDHCARITKHARSKGAERVEVRPEAEEAWRTKMAEMRVDHDEYFAACTPGYRNLEGAGDHVYHYYYGAGPVAYRFELEAWIATRLDDDLVVRCPA